MSDDKHNQEDVDGDAVPGVADLETKHEETPSVFDMFEPPPEIDAGRFGPIPIVPGPADAVVGSTALVTESIMMGEPDGVAAPAVVGASAGDITDNDETTSPDSIGSDPDYSNPGYSNPDFNDAVETGIDEQAGSDEEVDAASSLSDAGAILNEFFGEEGEQEAVSSSDPQPISVPQVSEVEPPSDLPHWTEPATGQVPAVVTGDQDDETWSELSGPRWHGEGPEWAGDDLADVFGFTSVREGEPIDDEAYDDEADAAAAGSPQRRPVPRQRPSAEDPASTSGRNVPQAIAVGCAVAGLAGLAFYLGNVATISLVVLVAVLGGLELFNTMREVGVHPATLLGTVASGAMPLAVYHRGQAGFMLVAVLLFVFAAVWYIVGADTHRPALNMGLTMLGALWVGGLASFAALVVHLNDGMAILLFAVAVTVVFDTAAYAGGRAFGRRPFHSASPNKTWEGTLAGVVGAVTAAMVMGLYDVSDFSMDLKNCLIVGLVAGVLAPLGDLTESMIKRDLGVKDMGTLLPGHGGVLDRIDGLLFVLPGVYYMALLLL